MQGMAMRNRHRGGGVVVQKIKEETKVIRAPNATGEGRKGARLPRGNGNDGSTIFLSVH